jgi:heme exporter protein A
MVLSFQNITHELGGNVLFQDVGFSLEDGCLLIVKGPNGCGKTTLLKILAGLMVPKYGFVFEGADDDIYEISEDYRRYFTQVQFLGHKNALDADLTVLENLKFYAGISNGDDALDAVIKFFSLERYLNTPVKYLSAGWKRRVALSRLMLNKSKIWILDEPFSNLDSEMIDITLKMIATFCDQGGKIIMSCHQELNLPFGMELQLVDFVPEN